MFLYVWNTMSRLIVFSVFSLFLNSIVKHRAKIDRFNLELVNKDLTVTESIKYAKTIQDSIIPSFSAFSDRFQRSFMANQPKDILSGDFFWSHKVDELVYFAIVDCTGHGIPGSLLSIIGNILIQKLIVEKALRDPSEILHRLHDELVQVFSAGNEIIDDGMEISLVQYDQHKSEISISQTMQGLIMVPPNSSATIFESNGHTIGGLIAKRKGAYYTSETVAVEKGTWLYLFSDGYVDQYGSVENEKFGIENLTNVLTEIRTLPAHEQYSQLTKKLDGWKGQTRQTDDIMVVGVQL